MSVNSTLTYSIDALEAEDIELGAAQDAFDADADDGYASDAEALDTQSEREEDTLRDLGKDVEGELPRIMLD